MWGEKKNFLAYVCVVILHTLPEFPYNCYFSSINFDHYWCLSSWPFLARNSRSTTAWKCLIRIESNTLGWKDVYFLLLDCWISSWIAPSIHHLNILSPEGLFKPGWNFLCLDECCWHLLQQTFIECLLWLSWCNRQKNFHTFAHLSIGRCYDVIHTISRS